MYQHCSISLLIFISVISCITLGSQQRSEQSPETGELGSFRVLLFFSVLAPTPFLEESLTAVCDLLSNNSTKLEIHLGNSTQRDAVERAANRSRHRFNQVRIFEAPNQSQNPLTFDRAAAACNTWDCDFLFYIESHVHLRHPLLLYDLYRQNETVIAPHITSFDGKLRTSSIESPTSQGVQSTEAVGHAFLMRRDFLYGLTAELKAKPLSHGLDHPSLVLIPTKPSQFGNIMSLKTFGVPVKHKRKVGELWEMFSNPKEWEERYIHKDYEVKSGPRQYEQPCPDVFWFPLYSKRFCDDVTTEMEAFGVWSRGMNHDNITKGVDPRRTELDLLYATVDIYLWQINFNYEYLWIMRKYVYPLQLSIFPQHTDLPYTADNFVVRYRIGEQVKLGSHFDESHITLNVALSVFGTDYEGGGTLFERYDCAITKTRPGWGLLHPNRPTHRHLGLELKSGVRYIIVSFFNGTRYIEKYGDPGFK